MCGSATCIAKVQGLVIDKPNCSLRLELFMIFFPVCLLLIGAILFISCASIMYSTRLISCCIFYFAVLHTWFAIPVKIQLTVSICLSAPQQSAQTLIGVVHIL